MPNKKIDWDKRLKEINTRIAKAKPTTTVGNIFVPQTAVIPINYRTRVFDRIGFLSHTKDRIRYFENGVCKTQIVETKRNKATISLGQEKIDKLSKTFSTQATKSIQAGLSSTIKATAGNDVVGKVEGSVTSQLNASKSSTNLSAKTIATELKSKFEVKQEVTLASEPKDCFKLEVPYGVEMIVTVVGRVTIRRDVKLTFDPTTKTMKATGWAKSKITVNLKIDGSVGPATDNSNSKITKARCESCDANDKSGSSIDKDKTEKNQGMRKEKPERKQRKISNRKLHDLEGVGEVVAARLIESGITMLNELIELDPGEAQLTLGFDEDTIYNWQAMATWLIEYEYLTGNDAQLLVEGLGMEDVDQLDIGPLPSELEINELATNVELPADYSSMRILELFNSCRCE